MNIKNYLLISLFCLTPIFAFAKASFHSEPIYDLLDSLNEKKLKNPYDFIPSELKHDIINFQF